MSPTITLKGAVKFSVKKLLIGGELSHSHFTGPGELLLAPSHLGSITVLRIGDPSNPNTLSAGGGSLPWHVARDGFLACTQGVVKEYKSQGLSKGLFSGEGFFVYRMTGHGLVWMTSFGAILRKDLKEGEKYVVDNGHLVAWNCGYVLERAASGGLVSGFASGEGLVCKFSGKS